MESSEQQTTPASTDEIRQLIASVLYGGRRVHLSLKDGGRCQTDATFNEVDDTIELLAAKEDMHQAIAMTVDGYNTSYSFSIAGLAQPDNACRLRLPKIIRKQQRRARSRVKAPRHWEVRYLNADALTVSRSLRDISLDGLSMRGGPADEDRFSGRILTPVEIYDGTTRLCSLVAELRNITYVSGQQGAMVFGMSLRALKEADWRAWENTVTALLHPNTRDGRQMSSKVWELFGKSGYFNLSDKDPAQFVAQKQAHEGFNRILEKNPGLGTHMMWHGGGEVQASLSTCMPYAHTAIMHQMAKAPGDAANRVVLRDMLIHSFEYLKQLPSLHYVAALLNAKVVFNQFAFLDIAEAQKTYKMADVIKFRLVEVDSAVIDASATGLIVTEAAPDDYQVVAERVIAMRGRMYAEAFDQTEEKLSAAVAKLRWRDVGIERDRRIFIARDSENHAIAAAIVDVSPTGSNLFSIFDAFTTFSLIPGVDVADPDAVRAMLQVTRRWFARLGRDKFVWHDFDEQADSIISHLSGVKDLGYGRVWVVKRELIATLQEFWYTHLMRPRKKSNSA